MVVDLPSGVTVSAADFHLLVDGNSVATADDIKSFRDWRQGMAIAVCVDVSGTMSRGPLDEVKAALSALFKKVRPNDRFALISFADKKERVIIWGAERPSDQSGR